MLSNPELEKIAQFKRLSLRHAEKDYLQDVLLLSLYSYLKDEFVFKGGTCLQKVYKLNRFSEDLDFTYKSNKKISRILPQVLRNIEFLNIKVMVKEIQEFPNGTNVRLLLNGPLFTGNPATQCFIPLNISKKEKVILEPQRTSYLSSYPEIATFELFAMREEEILAEKIRTIYTRDKPRDVYDLWFLLTIKKIPVNFSLLNKKLQLYSLHFDRDTFQEQFIRKKNAWATDLQDLIGGKLPAFEEVQNGIMIALAEKHVTEKG